MTKKSVTDDSIAAKNKALILDAAIKAFATNGFNGASVQQIADKANLPKTNVLYYFKSKQELYMTIINSTVSVWNSAFDQATIDDDPADVLAQYIADKMEVSRIKPYASKVFAMEILGGANNLSSFFKEQHIAWLSGRTRVLQHWIDEGKMAALNPEFLLYHIWACTQHYADFSAQIIHLRGKKMVKQDFTLATQNLIQLILTGCHLSVPTQYRCE